MEERKPLTQAAGRMVRFGGVAALLAWLAILANCGGGPTSPDPVVSLAVACPAPVQVSSFDGNPVAVSYTTPSAVGGTAPTTVSCTPASGSAFPLGATNVTCAARDSAGRSTSCVFAVTVSRATNNPPTITALTLSPNRVEVNGQVQATASVQDAETAPSAMQYLWAADRGGTFTGQGATVTWQAPNEPVTPIDARLTVTVVETYGGTLQHRVSRTSDPVRIHNSRAEISSMVTTFLTDFANSAVSPEVCVRNFSDSCPGKRDELGDIANNRATYVILSSSIGTPSVNVVTPFSFARASVPCAFESRYRATGVIEKVAGTCNFTATYEQQRWWLCSSTFSGVLVPAMKQFFDSQGVIKAPDGMP